MSSSSSSYSWLAGCAALGALGGMIPITPMPGESSRAREIRLRKEKSYEDLLKAAAERDKAQTDSFNRSAAIDQEEIAPAARPKKRSKLKRAWDRVLIGLHLKKKAQPVAPELIQIRDEVRPRLGRHVGIPSRQDDLQSSSVAFHRDAQTQQGASTRKCVHFDSPSEADLLCCTSSISDDASSSSSPVAMYGPTDKSQEPESTGW